jgi:hypothetical protein
MPSSVRFRTPPPPLDLESARAAARHPTFEQRGVGREAAHAVVIRRFLIDGLAVIADNE